MKRSSLFESNAVKGSFAAAIPVVAILVLATRVAQGGLVLVELKPVVVSTATADPQTRSVSAPDSVSSITAGQDFFIEIWASNVAGKQPGLACVSTDVRYPTAFLDAVSPIQNGPLFPISPVAPVFDDITGLVDNCAGCQGAPADPELGVNNWVMTDRIKMHAQDGFLVGTGDYRIELVDAANIFAGVSLIGDFRNLTPDQVNFQSVQITPEPATLLLLSFAALFVRCRGRYAQPPRV